MNMKGFLLVFWSRMEGRVKMRRAFAETPLDLLHRVSNKEILLDRGDKIIGVNLVDADWNITKKMNLEEVAS